MNKTFLLIISLFAIILISSVSAASAADVAYVVKTSSNTNVTSALNDLGYSYDTITDSQIASTNFSNYAMIVVQGNVANRDKLPLSSKNTLLIVDYMSSSNDAVTLIWPGSSLASSSTIYSNLEQLGTPFTEGFSEINFPAYTTSKSVYYLKIKPSYVSRVALTAGSGVPAAIVAYSNRNNLRNVFFGFPNSDYWTADTKKLFKNSLKWAIKQQCTDTDGDHYINEISSINFCENVCGANHDEQCLGNNDCNDNNKNLWNIEQGYLDSDKDNFGTGNLVNVCSGTSLPLGYSDNYEDCDDDNADINPDVSEIPYDEIDQDCDGYDIGDVDEDGYCNTEFLILNKLVQCPFDNGLTGTDCNDNDASINPGSSDPDKSCNNHQPVIEPIGKITKHETEDIVVAIIASDSDRDDLTYSIDDPRFEQDSVNENVFTWKTEYGDEDNYNFQASVSDGRLTTDIDFSVEILDKNIVPVCNNIPEQIWDEDESLILNLNDYCSDEDDDILSYSVSSATENSKINANIENSAVELLGNIDWSGEEWIIFKASDGKSEINTNKIILKVNPVNDEPVFNGTIENQNWNQNTNLTNRINLNDFFSDIDSNLIFSVSGNQFIDIMISNGLVSFYPESDWFGQENVTFSASDGEEDVNSNEIVLNVNYVSKPPVFEDLNCTTDLLEDTNYSCELSATDPENETILFSIVEEDSDLECSIDGNTLNYIGNEDYFGDASCIIRASDSTNSYSDKILEVQITNINDAPVIKNYSPKILTRMLAGKNYVFSVSPEDSDSPDLTINWSIDSESVGTATNYTFNKPKGNYQIIAEISDGQYNVSQIWDMIVGNINEFSCSEMNGYVCSVNQTCSQSFLGVYDSDKCCAVACIKAPPQFKAIKDISASANKTDNLVLTITEPANQTKFNIEDSFNVRVNVENRLADYDIDSNVEVYLYDITKEKVIASKKDSYKLSKNSVRTINTEFITEVDLKEDNEYAIFARVIGEDKDRHKFYNQKYNEIRFNRKDHNIVIQNMEISPENGLLCGDYADVFVNVENTGRTDEDIVIILTNTQLKINDKTIAIKLEKHGEDDEIEKKFSIKIPESAKTGEYAIRASVSFADKTAYSEKKLNIECRQETTQTISIETIKLDNQEPLPVIPTMENSKTVTFFVLDGLMIALVMISLIMLIIARNNYRNKMAEKRIMERKSSLSKGKSIRKRKR